MVNFKKLTDKAKDVVDKRGGVDSLKEDAQELRGVAKGKGGLKDKAKAAAEAVKEPGAPGSGPERKPSEAAPRSERKPSGGEGPPSAA